MLLMAVNTFNFLHYEEGALFLTPAIFLIVIYALWVNITDVGAVEIIERNWAFNLEKLPKVFSTGFLAFLLFIWFIQDTEDVS